MKKILFLTIFMMMGALISKAQNIILDFETPETKAAFSYFENGDWPDPQTSIVGNPDKSGINTSDSVLYFVRGIGGQTYAGAYGNPGPSRPIDFTTDNRMKVKVWAEKTGNLQLKLEGGPAGGDDNLERIVPINVINQWVELEFDVTLPGDAGLKVPAAGKIYKNYVIFADFLQPTTERTYLYLDDFSTGVGSAAVPQAVTFVFNSAGFGSGVTSASVAGTFNGWDANANPMTEVSAGTGLYTTTVDILPGVIEYKFVVNGSNWEEGLNATDDCIVNNGGFINRKASISGETTLPITCWNKCYNCGENANITINMGFPAANPPSPDGVYIAGGSRFEAPGGKYKMTDSDGDGIYSITINREIGFSSHFAMANGPCPDYSCKEDLAGQSCGDANNFNDRRMQPVTQDTVVNVCFGDCSGQSCILATKTLKDAGFSISPNPANSRITLDFDAYLQKKGAITVSNIVGNQVLLQAYPAGTNQINIDIDSFAPGVYIVTYTKDGKIGTKLFIKN
ncbi:MAG: T9SS type A sorting domain-containing protein [Saprospiraceae bacterium]|nr:T9SS type A sorting domain-containing protein [Candidatus Brachybacter algidus]